MILDNGNLEYWMRKIRMPDDAVSVLGYFVQKIIGNPELMKIFIEFKKSYMESGMWKETWKNPPTDPCVEETFGAGSSLYYLLFLLYLDVKFPRSVDRHACNGFR